MGVDTAFVVTCAQPVEVGGDKVESVRIKLILQLSFVEAIEDCSDRQAVHQLHRQQAGLSSDTKVKHTFLDPVYLANAR